MNNFAIIFVAAAVLAVAILLIIRELRPRPGPVDANKPKATPPTANATAAPPRASTDDVEDEDDVTKVGGVPTTRRASVSELPRLGAVENESDEAVSESSALTLFADDAEVDEPTGPHELILLTAFSETDPGKRRRRNEDSHLVDEANGVFVIADGMGGYAGGEIASRIAVETIGKIFATGNFDVRDEPGRPRRGLELVAAIETANALIYEDARGKPEYHGMGTTVVAARFSPKKQRVFITHVGDSRCYRLRAGALELMTTDHTYAEKGVSGAMGAHIRRAVGISPRVKVDLMVDCPKSEDVYLLCSDGLNKMLTDETTKELLIRNRADLVGAATGLIEAANAAGGKDNVTVVLIGVRETTDSQRKKATTASPAAGMPAPGTSSAQNIRGLAPQARFR
jgi:protein phosphatase